MWNFGKNSKIKNKKFFSENEKMHSIYFLTGKSIIKVAQE